MAEIKHNLLRDYLDSLRPETIPPVFLIWGEEFICRKVFDTVVDFLLPGHLKEFGYELLEGEDAVIPVIMERLCTYSVFQDRQVIAVKNAPLFGSTGSPVAAGFTGRDLDNLLQLIEKGFPENHYLVITSSTADKRRTLFSAIKSSGVALDCTVSQGSGKADKNEQAELLRITMTDILDRTGKGIDGDAFQSLTEMTGFDPVTLNDNLERLTAFIGNRDTITLKDVHSVIRRTRKDAIFELTNAVAKKNLDSSLFYYNSLCDSGFHPLQLLAAIVNQMRKILVVKAFIENEAKKGNICWHRGNQSYQQFTANTMPFVIKADAELQNTLLLWSDELGNKMENEYTKDSDSEKTASKPKGKKTKIMANKKNTTDLVIAPNPKNAYPVYQTFLKSDNFGIDELASIMMELSEMDYRFKSSSDGDQAIVLEEMIMRICTNGFQKNR